MPVVTIAREFGAGGEIVGQLLARRLHADLLDKTLIREVAHRLEMSEPEVEPLDESPDSLLHRMLTALGSAPMDGGGASEVAAWTPPYSDPHFDPRAAILKLTQEVIREAARTGNAVIVGRGGAYILRDHPDALHVFLRGALEARVKMALEMGGDEERVRRRLKQTDANRAAYIRQVYGHDWAHPSHYDLVIDTARVGYKGAVEAILAVLDRR